MPRMPDAFMDAALSVPPTLLEQALDHGPGAAPLRRQLFQRLRQAILDGRLAAGCPLPGSRALAEGLFISQYKMLDTLQLMVHPVVAGSGTHLFQPGDPATRLVLQDSRTTSKGTRC